MPQGAANKLATGRRITADEAQIVTEDLACRCYGSGK